MIEVNVNFVLFEELEEKPNANGIETHVVIIRTGNCPDSAFAEEAGESHDALE